MARSGSSASGGGGGTNSGTNNKNQTTSANEASLNHGSILIKFISIIMTIGVIIHIWSINKTDADQSKLNNKNTLSFLFMLSSLLK